MKFQSNFLLFVMNSYGRKLKIFRYDVYMSVEIQCLRRQMKQRLRCFLCTLRGPRKDNNDLSIFPVISYVVYFFIKLVHITYENTA